MTTATKMLPPEFRTMALERLVGILRRFDERPRKTARGKRFAREALTLVLAHFGRELDAMLSPGDLALVKRLRTHLGGAR